MSEYLITTEADAKKFKNLLDSYWMDTSNAFTPSNHIARYYKIEQNIPFIDNYINNSRAATLALSCSDHDLLKILLLSNKIKDKKYSVKTLMQTLEKYPDINKECAFLLIDCFENRKEIFEDISAKTKKIFIKSAINYFIRHENSYDQSFFDEHQDFFFEFLKKYKVNPYENKYFIIDDLIDCNRIRTLDALIDKAKKNEDKEKILYGNYDVIPIEMEDFLRTKRKEYEYIILKNSLSTDNNSKAKVRKTKI